MHAAVRAPVPATDVHCPVFDDDAPTVQIALVSRKADAQDVRLAAVQKAVRQVLESGRPRGAHPT